MAAYGRGDADAQFNLAHYYSVGKGVRRHERKAAYWLLQSARQGDGEAALHMAARYWQVPSVFCIQHRARLRAPS
jgi:TPR repeat protein